MYFWLEKSLADAIRQKPEEQLKIYANPQSSIEFFTQGVIHRQLKQRSLAERSFHKALELNLTYLPALYALSLYKFEKGGELAAKPYMQRAIRLDAAASKHLIDFQRELKIFSTAYDVMSKYAVWCLKELEASSKTSAESKFQLGKILFEQSRFEDALPYLRAVVRVPDMGREATEYLSYIYEHLYHGVELIDRTLDLADDVVARSDLFFNLAMVCQHEQKRADLAMHFFYLAAISDPNDPGLRYSLEQACLDLIAEANQPRSKVNPALVMLAHLYQGSKGLARRYAHDLRHLEYPLSFENLGPKALWQRWLLADESPIAHTLREWFSESPTQEQRLPK